MLCITAQGCKHKQHSVSKVWIFQPAVLLNHSSLVSSPRTTASFLAIIGHTWCPLPLLPAAAETGTAVPSGRQAPSQTMRTAQQGASPLLHVPQLCAQVRNLGSLGCKLLPQAADLRSG